eukprot:15454531-Alexandrium_andersonii.AAC.1
MSQGRGPKRRLQKARKAATKPSRTTPRKAPSEERRGAGRPQVHLTRTRLASEACSEERPSTVGVQACLPPEAR